MSQSITPTEQSNKPIIDSPWIDSLRPRIAKAVEHISDPPIHMEAQAEAYWSFAGNALLEVQALDVPQKHGKPLAMVSKLCTSAATYAAAIEEADKLGAMGVYCHINQLNPAVASRSSRLAPFAAPKTPTSINDFVSWSSFFIDFDPKRPSGVSASDAEALQARDTALACYAALADHLGSDNCLAFGLSGNGYQIHVALDHVPANTSGMTEMLSRLLAGLSGKFSTPMVSVDQSVKDIKRLAPAWGTTKRKGSNDVTPLSGQPARPHRRTWLAVPETVERLTLEDFGALVDAFGSAPSPTKPTHTSTPAPAPTPAAGGARKSSASWDAAKTAINAIDIADLAARLGLGSGKDITCPGCKNTDGVAIYTPTNGAPPGIKCHHSTCSAKFRPAIPIVMAAQGCDRAAAIGWLCQEFGFPRPSGGAPPVDPPTKPLDHLLEMATTPEGADQILAKGDDLAVAALAALDDGQRLLLAKKIGCPTKALRLPKPKKAAPAEGELVMQRGDHQEIAETIIAGLGDGAVADGEEVYKYNPSTGVHDHIHSDVLANSIGKLAGTPVGAGGATLKISDGTVKGSASRLVQILRNGRTGYFAESNAIGFANGVLVMGEDGEIDVDDEGNPRLHPHSPSHRLLAAYDWPWDPADADKSSELAEILCPLMACKYADFTLLMEMVGTSLWGLAPRYNRYLILLGAAGSGKSTILHLIKACTPPALVCSVAPQDMAHEYNRAALSGKRINLVYDLPQKDILDTGALKQIITGDLVSARRLYTDPIDIQPVAGHIFAANVLPRHSDDSDGVRRRTMIIEFPHTIEDKDPRALARLLTHKRAFVAAAMVSAARVAANAGYSIPDNSHRLVDEWCGEANNAWLWADERAGGSSTATSISVMYANYKEWATDGGYRLQSIKTFSNSLRLWASRKSLKFEVKHTKHGNVITGIGLSFGQSPAMEV